jgi:hypothetical protein
MLLLDDLSNKIGSRLSGSAGAESGSIYKSTIRDPWLRSCISSGSDGAQMGERRKETAYIQDNKTKITVPICALGGSVATAKTGLTAEVIEVHKELAELGDKIKGKIVFFNRPMDNEEIESFHAYSGAGDQRNIGAGEAAKFELSGLLYAPQFKIG